MVKRYKPAVSATDANAAAEGEFALTGKQAEAQALIASSALHIMLFGGSRSGKTFLHVRTICLRAIAASGSRHAILRLRFNHVKNSIALDTFPAVMRKCFPHVKYHLDKTDWYAEFPNGSQIWFGGLDDKDRTEKILGMEFATILLNECSQLSWYARNMVVTRLAQRARYVVNGETCELRRKMLYDCNPPSQAHWTYKVFKQHKDPDTREPLDAARYASMLMNPKDNPNLPEDYLESLDKLSARMRRRFRDGEFADVTENALFTQDQFDTCRSDDLPDMQRIVVAVDPSGASDDPNQQSDEIGIVIAGLGLDGRAYVLEDATVCAGPATWGKVAVNGYRRHAGDLIVGETNYGGEMVKFVIKTQDPNIPFKKVTASRGKVVRAEPISSLVEEGKIRFAGQFEELEDELCSMTTAGYIGAGSPNRADAFVWAMTELFPGMVKKDRAPRKQKAEASSGGAGAWMGV